MDMKKQTGIWLDLRNAYIIDLLSKEEEGSSTSVRHLVSGIEESAATGGTRSKTPWGPQGGDNQRSAQERRHHEEKHFFEKIIAALDPDTDELVLFGPSEAKDGLLNDMETHKHFHPKVKGVESADQMTQHQMEAWVRDYFKHPAPRHLPKRT